MTTNTEGLKIGEIENIASEYDAMLEAEKNTTWQWVFGRMNSLVEIIRTRTSQCDSASSESCVFHDEYALFRKKDQSFGWRGK